MVKDKNTALLPVILILAMAGVVGFLVFLINNESKIVEPPNHDYTSTDVEIREIYKGDWGMGDLAVVYKTPGEIYRASKLVVIGTPYGEPIPILAEKYNSYVGTRFRVEKVLKGNAGDEIVVAGSGIYDKINKKVRLVGKDPLKPGEKYLLFLLPAGNPYVIQYQKKIGEIYMVTGAWQGEFRIINGRVYSRNVLGEAAPEGLKVKGMPYSEFVAEMKK